MIRNLLCTCVLALGSTAAMAQAAYPGRPITFIYPYPAGGIGDTITRALGEEMSKRLGQPVIVENRPGASGVIGNNAAAKAPADGYTVLVTLSQSVLNNQFLFSKLPYDAVKDLSFITEICGGTLLLTTNAGMPVKNGKELLGWAATHTLRFGSWGVGSYSHLASAYLAQSRKLDIVHVAYKGEAPMIQDLIGGQINVAFTSLFTARSFMDTGKLRVLAVTGDRRLTSLPNVPTLAEAGLPDPELKSNGNILMMVPSGTPAPIKARLEKEARAAIATESFRARLDSFGFYPIGNDARQARENYETQYPIQKRLVELSGAKLD